MPANLEAEGGLRETITHSTELSAEFLDYPRFDGESYIHTVTTFLREKYALRQPNVLVIGGVPVEYDFFGAIDQALRWHPQVRRLVVVTGAAAPDREFEAQLRDLASRFNGRATTEFLAGLPTDAVLKRLGELGEDAMVFTPGYFQDGDGRTFAPREAARLMAAAATAPVYGPFNTFIGVGIVGGFMPNFAAMGRQAGDIVNRLLDGAAPAELRLPAIMPTTLNVDWRQIRRWGIDEQALPGDAIVRFKEPTFQEGHRTEVFAAAAVFLLQTGLIAGFLLERRRRMELAVQQLRFELAHAARLAVAGELTGAIAHEINQPLGAILSNAAAADLLLAVCADRRDELREILADIRCDDLRASAVIHRLRALLAKQPVERQLFDLNSPVGEVESVLRAEARRRGVALDVRPAAIAAPLVGDRVQIQQVLLNLVLNALDAVADLPEERRVVTVSVEIDADRLALVVGDRGQGIAPEHLPKLFDSFFSTKRQGMGLGLSIARTLVEAHGGHIRAESGPGEGAVLRAEWLITHGTGAPEPA